MAEHMTPAWMTKRALVAGLLATGAAACTKKPVTPVPDEMALGNPKAPITVIEYASVACPVCGRWYREVFADFKAKYIDTGKVYYIAREMLVGDATEESIAAAGFLLARCAGKEKYFDVVDAIFKNQQDVYADPKGGLLKIAKANGIDDKTFDTCVNDPAALQALNARVQGYAKDDGVNSTPTFVINGAPMDPGYHTLAEIDAAIAAAPPRK